MARRFLKRILPDQDSLGKHRLLRVLGPWLLHPAVWTLHRKSVAGGVAAGLFFGMFPAPTQMLGAAIVSILFHWNLPVAILATLYTNPVTFIPLYLLALKVGIWILNALLPAKTIEGEMTASAFPAPPEFDFTTPVESFTALFHWGLGMGWPLVVGVLILATVFGVAGYFITRIGWNLWVRWEVVQRRKKPRRTPRS